MAEISNAVKWSTKSVATSFTEGTDYVCGIQASASKRIPTKLFAANTNRTYNAMAALAVDITKDINTKSVTANSTFTLSGTPVAGQRTKVRLTGDVTLGRRITIPTYFDYALGQTATIVDVPAAGVVDLDIEYNGTRWEGVSTTSVVRYLPNQSELYIGKNVGGSTNNGANGGNIAIGVDCFISNVSSGDCCFMGYEAGKLQQSGVGSMGFGRYSLSKNLTGGNNTAFGDSALKECLTDGNGAFGYITLQNLTTGFENNAFGRGGLFAATTAQYNNTFGNSAFVALTSGRNNTGVGHECGYATTITYDNTAIGFKSLYALTNPGNTTGENTAVGSNSGGGLITGYRCTFLGASAGGSGQLSSAAESIAIGWAAVATKSNQCVLGQATITETLLRGDVVFTSLLASSTPATNGHMTIQATSNTSLTFKFKGSDSVVRSGTITLS